MIKNREELEMRRAKLLKKEIRRNYLKELFFILFLISMTYVSIIFVARILG